MANPYELKATYDANNDVGLNVFLGFVIALVGVSLIGGTGYALWGVGEGMADALDITDSVGEWKKIATGLGVSIGAILLFALVRSWATGAVAERERYRF